MTTLLIIDWFYFTERIQPGFQGSVTRFHIGISLIFAKANINNRFKTLSLHSSQCLILKLKTSLQISPLKTTQTTQTMVWTQQDTWAKHLDSEARCRFLTSPQETKDFRKFLTQQPLHVQLVGPCDSKGRFYRGKEFRKPEIKKMSS